MYFFNTFLILIVCVDDERETVKSVSISYKLYPKITHTLLNHKR